MVQTLAKTWWLLAIAGVLDAIYSLVNTFMQRPDGSLALRAFVHKSTFQDLGILALAAGVCAVIAGLLTIRNIGAWLLVLHGLALSALGAIFLFWRGPLAFRTVALLLIVMAVSLAILAGAFLRILRNCAGARFPLGFAGLVLAGFALVFLSLGFGAFRLPRPELLNVWMGSFFGFIAICLVWSALRLHRFRKANAATL